MQKLNWREKYAAMMVLLIGVIYLILQVTSLISSKGNSFTVGNDTISINRSQFLSDLRTYITIVLSFLGGILLLRSYRIGWIICVAILILFIAITGGILLGLIRTTIYDTRFFIACTGIFLLILALLFLLSKSAKTKIRLTVTSYFVTLAFSLFLIVYYFFLQ